MHSELYRGEIRIHEFERILKDTDIPQIIKLQIIKKGGYAVHTLKDELGNTYNLALEFHTEFTPQVGDFLYIFRVLLDRRYPDFCGLYAWGNFDNPCGRDVLSPLFTCEQMMKVVSDDKVIYLKRLYG